jgi:hypothetical protein
LAIFAPVGINLFNYQIESKFDIPSKGNLRYTGKGTDNSPFVGTGFGLKLVDNIYLNREYNYTKINYKNRYIYINKTKEATHESKALLIFKSWN